mmetsp:Transcript_7185/g.15896  ORF Transcript_7185/g.15896 Transcript_7185/m.15896 type:complete len:233 (+) Transcript_7185:1079-1777(+)
MSGAHATTALQTLCLKSCASRTHGAKLKIAASSSTLMTRPTASRAPARQLSRWGRLLLEMERWREVERRPRNMLRAFGLRSATPVPRRCLHRRIAAQRPRPQSSTDQHQRPSTRLTGSNSLRSVRSSWIGRTASRSARSWPIRQPHPRHRGTLTSLSRFATGTAMTSRLPVTMLPTLEASWVWWLLHARRSFSWFPFSHHLTPFLSSFQNWNAENKKLSTPRDKHVITVHDS